MYLIQGLSLSTVTRCQFSLTLELSDFAKNRKWGTGFDWPRCWWGSWWGWRGPPRGWRTSSRSCCRSSWCSLVKYRVSADSTDTQIGQIWRGLGGKGIWLNLGDPRLEIFMTRIWICGLDRIRSGVRGIQTEDGGAYLLEINTNIYYTCDHNSRQRGEWLTGEHEAPHVGKVLGLDAVVAIHLARVEEAAQAQAVQRGGEHIPDEWLHMIYGWVGVT